MKHRLAKQFIFLAILLMSTISPKELKATIKRAKAKKEKRKESIEADLKPHLERLTRGMAISILALVLILVRFH